MSSTFDVYVVAQAENQDGDGKENVKKSNSSHKSQVPCKRTQHCWPTTSFDVTCHGRLHTLLHVVGSCCAKFETSQTFEPATPNISFVPWSQKRSATTLDPFAQLFQHCSGHARVLRMVCKVLWVVSVPRCNAGPSIVRSCYTRLQTTANTDATTPNIIGPTLFGFLISSAARLRRPLS